MGKVIDTELGKRQKFGSAEKLPIHRGETVVENKTQILLDFEIKKDYSNLAKRPDCVVNKRKRSDQ